MELVPTHHPGEKAPLINFFQASSLADFLSSRKQAIANYEHILKDHPVLRAEHAILGLEMRLISTLTRTEYGNLALSLVHIPTVRHRPSEEGEGSPFTIKLADLTAETDLLLPPTLIAKALTKANNIRVRGGSFNPGFLRHNHWASNIFVASIYTPLKDMHFLVRTFNPNLPETSTTFNSSPIGQAIEV